MNQTYTLARLHLSTQSIPNGINLLYSNLRKGTFLPDHIGTIHMNQSCGKLEILICVKEMSFMKAMLNITEIFYRRIFSAYYQTLLSMFNDEVYFCSLEIPTYLKVIKFPIVELIDMGYTYNVISSYVKSNTYSLIRIAKNEPLHIFLNNTYNILLSSLGFSYPHQVRHRMAMMEVGKHKIKQLLDIGCGKGSFIFNLSTTYPDMELVGIDKEIENIYAAKAIKLKMFNEKIIDFFNYDIFTSKKTKTQSVTLLK